MLLRFWAALSESGSALSGSFPCGPSVKEMSPPIKSMCFPDKVINSLERLLSPAVWEGGMLNGRSVLIVNSPQTAALSDERIAAA